MNQKCVSRLVVAFVVAVHAAAHAAERVKANNADNLNLTSSWLVAVPNANDVANWNSTVTSENSVQLGADLSLRGLKITNPGGAVTVGGSQTLTLGSEGLIMGVASADFTLATGGLTLLAFSGQIWDVAAGRVVTVTPGTFTRSAGVSIGFVGAGTVTGSAFVNDATGIIGPWARQGTGTSTRYATVSGGSIAAYAGGTAAATAADVTDTTGAVNYDVAAVGTLGAGASFNTLRYTGAGGTIAGNFTANGLLNAGSGNVTFNGTTTIGANKELVLTSPDSTRKITFSGVIADNPGGASGLTVAGGGQVDLAADNTYSGQTVIGSGRIYMNRANALGSTSSNTVIHVNGSSVTGGILHVAGNITVAEPLTFVGPGDGAPWSSALYSNAGTNTLTGAITISTSGGCRIAAGGNGTGLNINGPITRTTSGNTLILGAGGAGGVVNVNARINNNGGSLTTHNGPGLIRLYSTANNFGTLNVQTYHVVQLNVSDAFVNNCSLQVGGANNSSGDQARGIFDMNGFSQTFNEFRGDGAAAEPPTVRVVTNSSPALSVLTFGSSNGGGTFNGHIDGNIALVKNGTGTSTLCGPNRHTGGTTVNNGTLVLSNAVNQGALAVNGGTFRFPPALTVTGSLSGTGGTIDTLAAGNVLTVNQTGDTTFAGAMTGAGALVKNGAGTLGLFGANTYSGGTTVNGGMLVFGRTNSIPGAGSITVASGARIGFGLGSATSFTQADVDALWAGTYPGITLEEDAQIGIDTTAGDATYATSQSGLRGLVKTGANTLWLSGANTYSGITVVRQGVLSITATSALPGWDTTGRYEVWPDAALAVQNDIADEDIATILGTGNFADGGCIGFDTFGGNRTYAEAIGNTANGALGVYKGGTNTLTLSAASTYDGNTVVNGGVLVVRNSTALGTANGYTRVNRVGGTPSLYTDSTGQLQLDGSGGPLVLDENFFISGAEQYGYSGALRNMSGNNVINGWIKIFGSTSSARIGVSSGTLTLNGPIERESMSINPMLVLNPSTMLIVSNRIDVGTGGLNFHSGGTVWLCATGHVWGSYQQIQYGCTVRLGVDNALPTGMKLTLGNPGTTPGNGRFDLYGYSQTVGGLLQQGNDASYPNNLIRNTQSGEPGKLTVSQAAGVSDTFYGRIIENVSLVMAGTPTSTLTLAATNSFTGSTTVLGGTLALGAAGTLGAGCVEVSVENGTLSLQNSAAVSDEATLILAGGGGAKVELAAGVNESVRNLFLNGKQRRVGTYGSSASPAANKDNTYFSGTGMLTVLRDNSGTVIFMK